MSRHWLALAAWAALPVGAAADEPLAAPMLTNNGGAYVQFELGAGRIHATYGPNAAGGGVSSMSSSSGAVSEQLRISRDGGEVEIRYERRQRDDLFSIDAKGSDEFKLSRTMPRDGKPFCIELSQTAGQPLRLKIGPERAVEEFRGRTLWHLLLAQPEPCRRHLVPLLDLMNGQWKLAAFCDAVEKELLGKPAGEANGRRARWAAWVADLADEEFAKREAADRNLRAAGPEAIGFLEQLDPKGLDAEQQFRTRRIIAALSAGATHQSAESVAAALRNDSEVWLAMLGRDDATAREAAARQLGALWGRPIAFDPQGEEAVRRRQLDRLRGEWQRSAAATNTVPPKMPASQ
jgi:hypothetical protein